MIWEWEHRSQRGRWRMTVGSWPAVVQRVGETRMVVAAKIVITQRADEPKPVSDHSIAHLREYCERWVLQ